MGWCRAVGSGLLVLFVLAGCVAQPSPATDLEAQAAAGEALDAAEGAFRTGDFRAYCERLAANELMCLADAAAWLDGAHSPPVIATFVTETSVLSDDSLRVRFEGRLEDGTLFTSETEALRTSAGEVRLVNPVFWVERIMIATDQPHDPGYGEG